MKVYILHNYIENSNEFEIVAVYSDKQKAEFAKNIMEQDNNTPQITVKEVD